MNWTYVLWLIENDPRPKYFGLTSTAWLAVVFIIYVIAMQLYDR